MDLIISSSINFGLTVLNLSVPFLQIEAARAGFGIAWLACYMADPVEDLVRVGDTEPVLSAADLWILMHRDMRRNVRIREFNDLLVKYFDGMRDRLCGNLVGGNAVPSLSPNAAR